MKPSPDEMTPDPARGRAPSGNHRMPAKGGGTRGRVILRIAVICLATALVFAVSMFLRRKSPSNSGQTSSSALAIKPTGSNSDGTIRLAPDGNSCREVKINNNTGQIIENRRVDCEEGMNPSGPRVMTRRLEAIRDGFAGR
jgi:hypothetical protein